MFTRGGGECLAWTPLAHPMAVFFFMKRWVGVIWAFLTLLQLFLGGKDCFHALFLYSFFAFDISKLFFSRALSQSFLILWRAFIFMFKGLKLDFFNLYVSIMMKSFFIRVIFKAYFTIRRFFFHADIDIFDLITGVITY